MKGKTVERKVLDMYGNELHAGDNVCFVYKYRLQSQCVVKAVVKEVKPYKDPTLSKVNEGWVYIEKYFDTWMDWVDKKPSKVTSSRVIKCY